MGKNFEAVKKILDQHWGEWGYSGEEQRNEIARQICQLFEPKPDESRQGELAKGRG